MPKYKTLKEIHQFLINNNLFHKDEKYLIKKGIIRKKESDKQNPAHSYKKPQILDQNGEIY